MRQSVLLVFVSAAAVFAGQAICRAQEQQAVAIAIGINRVSAAHYSGWTGPLAACESDANDMSAIAKNKGFSVVTLLTEHATKGAVLEQLTSVAEKMPENGILVLSYSGHGGQLDDLNGDEDDEKDETWCLYDGQLVDDELAQLWTKFRKGVRIVVFSDSCHSGTMVKFKDVARLANADVGDEDSRFAETREEGGEEIGNGLLKGFRNKSRAFLSALADDTKGQVGETTRARNARNDVPSPFRSMPEDVRRATYKSNQDFYDKALKDVPDERVLRNNTVATVLLISGCQDNQLSLDGDKNGLFTSTLKAVWRGGLFKGGYRKFYRSIESMMPPYQSPAFSVIGTPNPAFEDQAPYTR